MYLLYVPNRGKIPAKLDRAKLLAASALAAYKGYASTKKVKMPEYTRTVLHRSVLFSFSYDRYIALLTPSQKERCQ